MLKSGAGAKRLETWVQETFGTFKFVYCEFLTEKYIFVDFCPPQGNKLVNVVLHLEKLK